jgi:aminomethyltransferase
MAEQTELKKTPLYQTHAAMGAKLIEFGGWLMPVQYSGIIDEHKAVRTKAGLFDISHMGEFEVSGRQALEFLQYVTTNDVSKLAVGQAHYTCMCYPDGGIIDDLIIYRLPAKYFLVVNASNIAKDWDWLTAQSDRFEVDLHDISDATALISLQGRLASEILQPFVNLNLHELAYYHCAEGQFGDVPVIIARTGYTGEDGFELFCQPEHAEKIWQILLEAGKPHGLVPVGLGARDTLRLEAKMALYGNDIDSMTNPLEAGLGWIVKFDKGDFIAKDVLVSAKERGIHRRLVGFEMTGRGIARHGYAVVNDEGQKIGYVTSGAPAPTVAKNIGLAYVPTELSKIGTPFKILVRDNPVEAIVVKTPFYTRPK